MIDLTKPIETVPCARNPEPVPCEVTKDGRVLILDRWIEDDGESRDGFDWSIDPTTGRFLNLDGAVRNVVPKSDATPTDPPKTLRDEFAMAALTGLLAGSSLAFSATISVSAHSAATEAYKIADAMMAKRRKGGEA